MHQIWFTCLFHYDISNATTNTANWRVIKPNFRQVSGLAPICWWNSTFDIKFLVHWACHLSHLQSPCNIFSGLYITDTPVTRTAQWWLNSMRIGGCHKANLNDHWHRWSSTWWSSGKLRGAQGSSKTITGTLGLRQQLNYKWKQLWWPL